jgi:N-acetylglutamate synthase/N-acetylornithine aminotransferase
MRNALLAAGLIAGSALISTTAGAAPAAWGLIILAVGGVGATLRHRRASGLIRVA